MTLDADSSLTLARRHMTHILCNPVKYNLPEFAANLHMQGKKTSKHSTMDILSQQVGQEPLAGQDPILYIFPLLLQYMLMELSYNWLRKSLHSSWWLCLQLKSFPLSIHLQLSISMHRSHKNLEFPIDHCCTALIEEKEENKEQETAPVSLRICTGDK